MVERLGEMRKGRREMIEKGSRDRIERKKKEIKGVEMTFEEEAEEEHHHLPLLVFQLPPLWYSSEDMSSQLDSAAALKFSLQRSDLVKGLAHN